MKFEQFIKETLTEHDDDHFSANMNTPLREDAFEFQIQKK